MSDRRPPNPKQIRWCVSHSASTPPGADWCWPWDSGYAAQPGAAECFVVPMMLTDPDLMAAVRRGVESGTIKGTELNLCHVHGSVMTGAVFHEGTRVCQYAWYSGHAVEACFGYRGVVIPVSDGGSENMSWTKEITIWCDHDDCAPEWLMSDAVGGNTVAATRRHARRLGWVHRDGKDFCPEHSDGGEDRP